MLLNAAFQHPLAILVKNDSNWGPVAGFCCPGLNQESDILLPPHILKESRYPL